MNRRTEVRTLKKTAPELYGHPPPRRTVSPKPPARAELARLSDRAYYALKKKGV